MTLAVVRNTLGGEETSKECPNCRSKKTWKDGIRETSFGSTQRYVCRNCGHRFSESTVLSSSLGIREERRVCAAVIGAKNLDTATELKTVAGESSVENQGEIVEYLWHLKKNGYSEATVITRVKLLKILKKRGANLSDPEGVKKTIAEQESWCDGHKQVVVQTYNSFANMRHIQWKPPRYTHVKSLPFVPLDAEIDALISGTSRKVSASLQLLKETGMRIGEAWGLRWTDIDQERTTIRCRAEKHGNPREFKVSAKLLAMLNTLPKTSEYVFAKKNLNGHRWSYEKQRKRLAEKLQNPRLSQITFHTFRHWFASREYAKTNQLVHVQERLGHRNINSTMIYTHLIKIEGDQYYSAIAKTAEEAQRLIEDALVSSVRLPKTSCCSENPNRWWVSLWAGVLVVTRRYP